MRNHAILNLEKSLMTDNNINFLANDIINHVGLEEIKHLSIEYSKWAKDKNELALLVVNISAILRTLKTMVSIIDDIEKNAEIAKEILNSTK